MRIAHVFIELKTKRSSLTAVMTVSMAKQCSPNQLVITAASEQLLNKYESSTLAKETGWVMVKSMG